MAAIREYELVLMLDPGLDAPARDAVAQEAKGQIEQSGTLKHENTWGLRKLAYEIKQRNEADYRWFRFEAPSELLEQLDHNLKIADGVLRFRIFKVGPETPIMAPPASAAPGPSSSRERPAERIAEADEDAEPQAAAESAPTQTAVAEPPAEEAVAEPAVEEAGEESPPEASGEGGKPADPAE